MTKDEALKLALEALENMSAALREEDVLGSDSELMLNAAAAIRVALAQPEREPVALLWECLGRWAAYLVNNGKQAERVPPSWLVDAIKKATIPPQQEQKLIGTVGDLFDDRVIAHRKLDRDLLVYTAAP